MCDSDKLITKYEVELIEDHHSFGSGRYGARITFPDDISASFPYLNSVLEDSLYDHENSILIGITNKRRYAFRPHEIQLGAVADMSDAASAADFVIEFVNRTWRERDRITPSYRERDLPPIFDIFKLLPGANCRECGYPTCLACAADIRNGVISIEKCLLLFKPEYEHNLEQIRALLY